MTVIICTGAAVFFGGIALLAYSLCRIAAIADTYQAHTLRELEELNAPRITGNP